MEIIIESRENVEEMISSEVKSVLIRFCDRDLIEFLSKNWPKNLECISFEYIDFSRLDHDRLEAFKLSQLLLSSVFYRCRGLKTFQLKNCNITPVWRPFSIEPAPTLLSVLEGLIMLSTSIEEVVIDDCGLYNLSDIGKLFYKRLKLLSLRNHYFGHHFLNSLIDHPAVETIDLSAPEMVAENMSKFPRTRFVFDNPMATNKPNVEEEESEFIASDDVEAGSTSSDDVSLVSEGSDLLKL
jgi:hypothetical protein